MASVSSSHLILFIASLIIAASVAGTFTQGVQRLSSSLSERSLDVSEDVRTDVEIISDSGSSAVYNSSGEENITVLVKNTGSRDLVADSGQIDVLVDGRYQTNVTFEVFGGEPWRISDVVRIEISPEPSLDSGTDHRVAINVDGDEEILKFRT